MKALSEPEYLQTMRSPMRDVTSVPGEVIDIWSYIESVAMEADLPIDVIQNQFVEYVYRTFDDVFDHVLIPTGRKNHFLAVIVNRTTLSVHGHYPLDLNEKYGLIRNEH
jgi:hypothetical protein